MAEVSELLDTGNRQIAERLGLHSPTFKLTHRPRRPPAS
jgi:hypothetical protein